MNKYELDLLEQQREYKVVKSNKLVLNSRYQYSLAEQKSIAYICSLIKPIDTAEPPKEGEYQLKYEFNIADYIKLIGVESSGNQYQLVKSTLEALSEKKMWLPINDENGEGEVLVRWLSNVAIYKRSGKVKVKIDEYLAPYLLALQSQYLSYGLINILNFKSKYGIRLYEILKAEYNLLRSVAGKKSYETPELEWTIDLNELKRMLMLDIDTEKEKYKNFKDFRKKILETAQRDINGLSDMLFKFEPITKGRKVIKIVFKIRMKGCIERLATAAENQKQ